MKLALISDLHSQKECLKYLEEIISKEKPNGVICSGDITVGDDLMFLEKVFGLIKENNLEGFFIWGNADKENVQKKILESDYNVHLKRRIIEGQSVFGLSFLDNYPEFDSTQIKDSIFVTHQPPIKKNLELGSVNTPKFHISGHLHKIATVKKYPSTTHIQVPTLMDGKYALLETNTGKVDFAAV